MHEAHATAQPSRHTVKRSQRWKGYAIYIFRINFKMLEVRNSEIALRKLSGCTAQLRTLEGRLATSFITKSLFTLDRYFFIHSKHKDVISTSSTCILARNISFCEICFTFITYWHIFGNFAITIINIIYYFSAKGAVASNLEKRKVPFLRCCKVLTLTNSEARRTTNESWEWSDLQPSKTRK